MTDLEGFQKAEALFKKAFKKSPTIKEISYGRLEILGNHTDHQQGKCLVATCSLGIRGYIEKCENDVTIVSDGYPSFSFPAAELKKVEKEKFTTKSLTRGVLGALARMGYKVGGFNAAMTSDIFAGAGVSSSAAYELFIAEAINFLYNDNRIPRMDLAMAGQYAENVYFGKASGLLDQCGSAFGGLLYLDFKDKNKPIAKSLSFPNDWDLSIVLVNPGASHAGLSDLYSEMPSDMKNVAKTIFKKDVLREVDESSFVDCLSRGDDSLVSPRSLLRARHFYDEENRVERAYEAILSSNRAAFLELERETELSQETLLKNAMIPGKFAGSPLEAVLRANLFLKLGASRVMGGGLVGTTINFVPNEELGTFLSGMKRYYKEENIVIVNVPSLGAHIE